MILIQDTFTTSLAFIEDDGMILVVVVTFSIHQDANILQYLLTNNGNCFNQSSP